MAELLVCAADKEPPDPYVDAKAYKRGDVVVVCPDRWVWGMGELSSPNFRIVRVPGITVTQASTFLGEEFNTDPENPSLVLRRRAFYLDLDDPLFESLFPGWVSDDARQISMRRFHLTLPQLLQLKKPRPSLDDPNVLS